MALAAIYNLFIINKSGGLIYYKVCSWDPLSFFYRDIPDLALSTMSSQEPAHISRTMVQQEGWIPMTV
jgi:hypothetical protein